MNLANARTWWARTVAKAVPGYGPAPILNEQGATGEHPVTLDLLDGQVHACGPMFLLVDAQGRWVAAGDGLTAALRVTGKWRGRTSEDLIPGPAGVLMHTRNLEAFTRGGVQTHREIHSGNDGDLWWLHQRCRVVTASGQTMVLDLISDQTDLLQREHELQMSRERLQMAEQAASFGLYDWDVLRNHVQMDRRSLELHGLSTDSLETTYDAWRACVLPSQISDIEKGLQAALDDPKVNFITLQFSVCPDGKMRHMASQSYISRNAEGQPVRVTGVNRDVTEEMRLREAAENSMSMLEERVVQQTRELLVAKEKAEQANAAKSVFLTTMTHELRTPLNGILGMIKLMDIRRLDDESRELMTAMRTAADGLMGIVNDMLDIAKIEAGELRMETQPFDVHELLDNVLASMLPLVRTRQLELRDTRVEAPGWPRHLVGDRGRLRQILLNLLANALKYTQAGHIELRTEIIPLMDAHGRDGQARVTFWVNDTGIGVPSERQEAIFETFVQADDTVARDYGGTGLGLAICRELATRMGGRIGVFSEPDEGARFWVTLTLPVCAAEASARPGPMNALRPQALMKTRADVRLLVAEDHPLNQMLMHKLLQGFGFTPEQYDMVENGVEACAMLETRTYDMMIVDCRMPVMGGEEVVARLREQEALRPQDAAMVVLALTANATVESRDTMQAAGVDEYLTKPIDPSVLYDVLNRYIVMEGNPFAVAPDNSGRRAAYDLRQLQEFCVGDEEAERRLLMLFLEQSSMQLDAMARSLRDGDSEMWVEDAHKLKGGAGCVGAVALQQLAQEAQTAKAAVYPDILLRLQAEYAGVQQGLTQYMAQRWPDRGLEAVDPPLG